MNLFLTYRLEYDAFKDRAIAQSVSCRPLNMETRVRFLASLCEICGGQSGIASGFSLSILVLPYHFRFTNSAYSPPSACFSYRKDKLAKPGNLPQSMLFQKSARGNSIG
jgi:hypothetical protein